jgi:hypothetical protein
MQVTTEHESFPSFKTVIVRLEINVIWTGRYAANDLRLLYRLLIFHQVNAARNQYLITNNHVTILAVKDVSDKNVFY